MTDMQQPLENDVEHLRLLSIFHYINAGLVGMGSLLALMYVFFGIVAIGISESLPMRLMPPVNIPPAAAGDVGAQPKTDEVPVDESAPLPPGVPLPLPQGQNGIPPQEFPPEIFKMFGFMAIGFGLVFLLIGVSFAVASFLTGRNLVRRQHLTFCIVVAAIDCLHFPLGTLLGVFTLIVLFRPSVKEMFTS